MSKTLRRPVLRYHGGKWRLAPWIIGHFPPHRVYVEPFGGAASVLMRKPRSYAEVYNDLDGELVNVFRVLRDTRKAERLRAMLELTPWARREFALAYQPAKDPIEQARRTIVRQFMAYGTSARREKATGFRGKCYRENQTGAQDWVTYPACLEAFTARLRGVALEDRPALEIIAQQDGPETLFYCDPPYVLETRTARKDRAYVAEMTDDQHRELAAALHGVRGFVVLSGYPSPLYDELYGDWRQVVREAVADKGVKREECLWLSPRTAQALEAGRLL